jgi:pimeloyl-ACP methyl ester carboxylesterase
MQVLFFHSGPGLNSNPERQLLTGVFKQEGFELMCWNEPSGLRPDPFFAQGANAFEQYLRSAEAFLLRAYDGKPLVIIGHSFGAQAACYLANRHQEKLKHIVLLSSNLSVKSTDLNTFNTVASDYEKCGDSRAEELRQIISTYTGNFDDSTQRGFALVGENPRLFNMYWHNKTTMHDFLSLYTPPEYTLDVDGYFKVRKTWFEPAPERIQVAATAIYGTYDVIVNNQDEQRLVYKYFTQPEIVEFYHSAHFPHIEETGRLLEILKKIK